MREGFPLAGGFVWILVRCAPICYPPACRPGLILNQDILDLALNKEWPGA